MLAHIEKRKDKNIYIYTNPNRFEAAAVIKVTASASSSVEWLPSSYWRLCHCFVLCNKFLDNDISVITLTACGFVLPDCVKKKKEL